MLELRAVDDSTYQIMDNSDLTDVPVVPPSERRVHERTWGYDIECRPFPRERDVKAILTWLQEFSDAQKGAEKAIREWLHETQKAWKGLPEETRRLFRRSSRTEIRLVYVDYREFPPEEGSERETTAAISCHVYLQETR